MKLVVVLAVFAILPCSLNRLVVFAVLCYAIARHHLVGALLFFVSVARAAYCDIGYYIEAIFAGDVQATGSVRYSDTDSTMIMNTTYFVVYVHVYSYVNAFICKLCMRSEEHAYFN